MSMLHASIQSSIRKPTTDKTVDITQLLVHLSHSKVLKVRPSFCDKHQLPFVIGTAICRCAMIIEWNGNIEPELREVDNIDIDI
jgi:hypothetical protein